MQDLLRTNRIKDFFGEALDLDEASRTALLSRAAIDDPSIAIELRSLLSAHARAASFLREPADAQVDDDGIGLRVGERIGDRIDRYELVAIIGEGGFGRVYRAQQNDPVSRTVALKIIKAGMDTRQVIARFRSEQQALARMDHPGIAMVFDAGATAAGRPYFVMELVDGAPITAYCDSHLLPIEARLGLFRQVCAAVQHAHTKGVIHRDLKPSNVLVTMVDDQPQPKVIDFGIAKAASPSQEGEVTFTDQRHLLGTPEYMSPEQVAGITRDIDTRSDVYALGVLLHQLLTGATPFDGTRLREAEFGEMQRIIREEPPQRPSHRLINDAVLIETAKRRGTNSHRVIAQVRGDLDWITLKALEKDRERRYGSPAELAEDIRRHLDNQPVLAGPPGAAYRVGKFVRRNRIAVAAATVATLAVLAGAILATVGMLSAQASAARERETARQTEAVNDFMRIVLTSTNPERLGAEVRMSEALDAASGMVSQRFADHPIVEAQVRDVLATAYGRLSMWQAVTQQSSAAVELWKQTAGLDDPRTIESMLRLAESLAKSSRTADAQIVLDQMFPHLEDAFGETDDRWFGTHLVQAEVLWLRGHRAEAANLHRRLVSEADEPHVNEAMRVRLLGALTNALRIHVDDGETPDHASLKEYERCAKELLERSTRLGPGGELQVLNALQNLANAAFLRRDNQQAAIQLRRVLDESRQRLGECHSVRIWAMETLTDSLRLLGQHTEAADVYLRLLECTRASSGSDSPVLIALLSDAQIFMELDGRWALAEAFCRETIDAINAMGGHSGTLYLECRLAHFVSNQAGRHDEAEALFQPLLARDEKTISPGTLDWLHLFYADHLTRAGEFEHAERLLQAIEADNDLNEYGFTPRKPNDLQHQFKLLYEAWEKAGGQGRG